MAVGGNPNLLDRCDIIFVDFSFLFVRFGCMKMVSTTVSIDILRSVWPEIMFHVLMCGRGAHMPFHHLLPFLLWISKDIPALHKVAPGFGVGVMMRLPCGGQQCGATSRKL